MSVLGRRGSIGCLFIEDRLTHEAILVPRHPDHGHIRRRDGTPGVRVVGVLPMARLPVQAAGAVHEEAKAHLQVRHPSLPGETYQIELERATPTVFEKGGQPLFKCY